MSPADHLAAAQDAAPLFAALGDATRLQLLDRLSVVGPGSTARLSENAHVSRQAITKHLEVLAEAGLVRSSRRGRERIWELERRRLADARAWLDRLSREWDEALGRLKALVEDDPSLNPEHYARELEQTHITEQLHIASASAQLWPLITQGQHLQRWYAFGGAALDLRPGGAMTLRWDEHGEFAARIVAVEPPRRFVFRWLPEPAAEVEITLHPEGDGTRVQIVEAGPLEDAAQSALAWRNALDLLRALAAQAHEAR